jgi:TonB family protein
VKNRFFVCLLVLGLFAPAMSLAADQVVIDRSTRNKMLNDYALLTRDAIQRHWTTPINLNGANALKGKIAVNYIIRDNGTLEKLELVRGSGNQEMDRTLLAAIKTAAPFPHFPDSVEAKRILIRANFIVADTPTAPVIMANHEVAKKDVAPREPTPKKYIWGQPAGASSTKPDEQPSDEVPPRPEPRKYKWGI